MIGKTELITKHLPQSARFEQNEFTLSNKLRLAHHPFCSLTSIKFDNEIKKNNQISNICQFWGGLPNSKSLSKRSSQFPQRRCHISDKKTVLYNFSYTWKQPMNIHWYAQNISLSPSRLFSLLSDPKQRIETTNISKSQVDHRHAFSFRGIRKMDDKPTSPRIFHLSFTLLKTSHSSHD